MVVLPVNSNLVQINFSASILRNFSLLLKNPHMQAYASRLKRIEYFGGHTHRTNFEDMSMDQFFALTILLSCLHVNKYPHHTNHCHRPSDQDLSERKITELD